jgi:hypothetical protein
MGGACSKNGEKRKVVYRKSRGKETTRKAKIILRWSLEMWDGAMWTVLVWLGTGTSRKLL